MKPTGGRSGSRRVLAFVTAGATVGMLAPLAVQGALQGASAHTPNLYPSCGMIKVDLSNYNRGYVNTIEGTVDNQVVQPKTTFSTTFTKSYTLTKYESHSYDFKVVAGDDPYGRKGFTKEFKGTIPSCQTVMPVPKVPVVDECGPGNAHYGDVPEGHYTVTRNEDGSITLTATGDYVFPNGQTTVTLPAPQDSNQPCPVPPPPPAPPTPTVGHVTAAIATSCTGRARSWLGDQMTTPGRFVVRAKKGRLHYQWIVTVQPGQTRVFKFHGKKFPVGTKLTVRSGGHLLAKAFVPGRCSVPSLPHKPPNTGERVGGKA